MSAPLPFTVADAFAVLARASNGRFIPGNREAWKPGVMVNVQKHIRTHPNIAEWERLGRWLAAGGDAFRKDFSFAWAAGNGLLDAMARAAAPAVLLTAPRSPDALTLADTDPLADDAGADWLPDAEAD